MFHHGSAVCALLEAKKTPLRCRCGVFGSLQVCFYLPGHMPSARTSVGNKEYEYKGKKELAAQLQQHIDRDEWKGQGAAAVAVALRHVPDRKAPC